jgi:hypothetical protein
VRRFYPALVVIGVVMVVAACLPTIVFGRYANVDEAYASALGERLLEGYRLYQGAISQRGPMMYYAYELLDALCGWDNVRSVRVAGLIFALAHLALTWMTGRALFGEGVAAVGTLICAYALAVGLGPHDGLALNCEALQVPFALGGLLAGALGMREPRGTARRRLRLAAAGLLYGVAFTVKQTAALLPLPLLSWIVLDGLRSRERRRATIDASVYTAAAAFPVAVFVAQAWASGTLRALWYYCVTYNLQIHREAGYGFAGWVSPLLVLLGTHTAYFLLVAVAAAATAARWSRRVSLAVRARRGRALLAGLSVEDYVALDAFAALALAAAFPQHFGHSYLFPLPMLALTAAAGARRALPPGRPTAGLRSAFAAATALGVVLSALATTAAFGLRGLVSHSDLVFTIAGYIERATSSQDKIFVWGFAPWLYGYSHRRPAGRYVFATYVTGFVPFFWWDLPSEPARAVPGSLADLLGDLDRERPALVIDAGSVEIARPMRAYPQAAAWLRAGYCFESRIGAVDVYRRRADGDTCPTPYFPCPSMPFDHWGSPIVAPMPPVVDDGPSGYLGFALPDQPNGFTPGEHPIPCQP